MAIDPAIEAAYGAQKLQSALDMLNTLPGLPIGSGGRPAIFKSGTTPHTQAEIAAVTGLPAAHVAELAKATGGRSR